MRHRLSTFAILIICLASPAHADEQAGDQPPPVDDEVQFATYCKGKPAKVRWSTFTLNEQVKKIGNGCYLPWAATSLVKHLASDGWVDVDVRKIGSCGDSRSSLARKATRPSKLYFLIPDARAAGDRTVVISRRVMQGTLEDGGFAETGFGDWQELKRKDVDVAAIVLDVSAKKALGKEHWVQIKVEVSGATPIETTLDFISPVSC
jgi:hypothetical protein